MSLSRQYPAQPVLLFRLGLKRGRFMAAWLLGTLIAFMLAGTGASPAAAQSNPLYASFVIDADSGMVLHQRHADKSLHPASLAKVMTLMLVFDALDEGRLKLSDRVPISSHAASMVPSKLGLPAGSSIRVEDAIYALCTKSANDVAAALAEKIGGTEARFATMMTQKARQIGMQNTQYRNASGLHNPAQVSTARDQARMAQYLLRQYPQYYHYFSTRQFTYQGTTHRNHNRLMDSYRGMDGLKTGYINASGFNLVATAVRDNQRLIGVVFGGRTTASRNAHMARLLDNGFQKVTQLTIAARQVPLPPRKPDYGYVLAAMGEVMPSAGYEDDIESGENPRWAALNQRLQSKAFSAWIGQGDYDAAESNRFRTGLMAAEAHGNFKDTEAATHLWSVQIGAFSSRDQADRAIRAALTRLPGDMKNARAITVPLETREGLLFRGRLSGFTKEDAARACSMLTDCLTISPQAH